METTKDEDYNPLGSVRLNRTMQYGNLEKDIEQYKEEEV